MKTFDVFGIQIHSNGNGSMWCKDEHELYKLLEKIYFPNLYGDKWENISNKDLFHNGCKPDYRAWLNGIVHYYEIKNDKFRRDHCLQVVKYFDYLTERHGEDNYTLNTIASWYPKHRCNLLDRLDIEHQIIKDIVNPHLPNGGERSGGH